MMTSAYVSPENCAVLRAAVQRAATHPIPWATISQHVTRNQGTNHVKFTDEQQRGWRPQADIVELELDDKPFRFNVSYEEQPAGMLIHVSMSHDDEVPDVVNGRLVLAAAGFKVEDIARAWTEEFAVNKQQSGQALNCLFFAAKYKP